jgi:hypothetical protein
MECVDDFNSALKKTGNNGNWYGPGTGQQSVYNITGRILHNRKEAMLLQSLEEVVYWSIS